MKNIKVKSVDNNLIAALLRELLMDYNRVSLPCLGSFLGQYNPAAISQDGKTISPPSKKIVFHQNEIWNDEKLEKLISRRNNISHGEAKEKLAFWIDDICVSLATGEQVYFDGLGTLMVARNHQLVFYQDSPNLLADSFGLEEVPVYIEQHYYPITNASSVLKKQSGDTGKILIICSIILGLLLIIVAVYLFFSKYNL